MPSKYVPQIPDPLELGDRVVSYAGQWAQEGRVGRIIKLSEGRATVRFKDGAVRDYAVGHLVYEPTQTEIAERCRKLRAS